MLSKKTCLYFFRLLFKFPDKPNGNIWMRRPVCPSWLHPLIHVGVRELVVCAGLDRFLSYLWPDRWEGGCLPARWGREWRGRISPGKPGTSSFPPLSFSSLFSFSEAAAALQPFSSSSSFTLTTTTSTSPHATLPSFFRRLTMTSLPTLLFLFLVFFFREKGALRHGTLFFLFEAGSVTFVSLVFH